MNNIPTDWGRVKIKYARSKFKDLRQALMDEAPIRNSRSRKQKPFRVEWRGGAGYRDELSFRKWKLFGKYRSEGEARQVIRIERRKHPSLEYRLGI